MKKLLLKASTVLPVSSEPIKDAAVLIEGGKIIDVGPARKLLKDYEGSKVMDLGRGILLPGFINAHCHLELGWIKERIGTFEGFTGWLHQIIRGKREGVSNPEIQDSVKEGIESLIKSGCTTVGEISSYGGIDIPILKKSGLRTVLFREVLDSKEESTDFDNFERSRNFEERLFPHAPYSCSPELLKKTLESHMKSGIPIGIHLAESPDEIEFVRRKANSFERDIFPLIDKESFKRLEADTPVSYMKQLGYFDTTKITTIHMIQVGTDDISNIENSNIGIVLCPRSNLFLQVGVPPLKLYANFDRIGLGTDGLSSNYNLDFFEEMRTLHMLYSDAMGSESAYKTVYAATLGGACALFIDDRTGSIDKGKEADIIFLNADNRSHDDYLSVISSTPDNLGMLMVGGEILYSKQS